MKAACWENRLLFFVCIFGMLGMCKNRLETALADAILSWIPAFAGMTSRVWRLAKELLVFVKIFAYKNVIIPTQLINALSGY